MAQHICDAIRPAEANSRRSPRRRLQGPTGRSVSWGSHVRAPLTKLSAFQTWAVLLSLFVVGDLALVLMSVIDVAGGGTLLR